MKKLFFLFLLLPTLVSAANFADTDQMYMWDNTGSAQYFPYWSDFTLKLDSLYQPLDTDLTAFAGVTPSSNGLSLISAADYAAMRTLLNIDVAGTDNSTPVSIAGGRDYISINGQVLALGAVDLTSDVVGILPVAHIPADLARVFQLPTVNKSDAIEMIFDGCGTALVATTGTVLEIPWNATVTKATVVCDASDTLGFTVSTAAYGSSPTFSTLDTYALSSARTYQETGLSLSLTAGSLIRFDLTGTPSAATNCTVSLTVTKD